MKYLMIILLNCTIIQSSQIADLTCNSNYPKLDKALIELWVSGRNMDSEGATIAINQIDTEWDLIVPDLYQFLNPAVNVQDFNKDMDYLIVSMKISLHNREMDDLADLARKMLYQFKSLRVNQHVKERVNYPIDNILDMIEMYQEIDDTVHDQMFGLKYWFEFEDLVLGFQEHWQTYKQLSDVQISNCFPHITSNEHSLRKAKVEECLSYFLDSLDSGYRTDFEIPCDELGGALSDLLIMYSSIAKADITLKN